MIPASVEHLLVEVKQTNGEVAFIGGTPNDTDFSWFLSDASGCPPEIYTTTEDLDRDDARFYIKVLGEVFLSVNSITDRSFSVYPNPTSEVLFIDNFEHFKKIELIDIYGALLKSVEPAGMLSLDDLAQGVYFLKATDDFGASSVQQFIKR